MHLLFLVCLDCDQRLQIHARHHADICGISAYFSQFYPPDYALANDDDAQSCIFIFYERQLFILR